MPVILDTVSPAAVRAERFSGRHFVCTAADSEKSTWRDAVVAFSQSNGVIEGECFGPNMPYGHIRGIPTLDGRILYSFGYLRPSKELYVDVGIWDPGTSPSDTDWGARFSWLRGRDAPTSIGFKDVAASDVADALGLQQHNRELLADQLDMGWLPGRIPQFDPQLHPHMAQALWAAWLAGENIRRGYAGVFDFEEKAANDYVSRFDRAADFLVREFIASFDPNATFIAEESGTEDRGQRSVWTVDGLDSTLAFVYRLGKRYPAVLISHATDGVVDLSVAYCPLVDEWFYAVKGKGAYRNGERILPITQDISLKSAGVVLNHYSVREYSSPEVRLLEDRLASANGTARVTSDIPHSVVGCRAMLTPDPRFDNYPRVVVHDNSARLKQCRWDFDPIGLFVAEAGGVAWNLRDGKPYRTSDPQPFIIARTERLARDVRGFIYPLAV